MIGRGGVLRHIGKGDGKGLDLAQGVAVHYGGGRARQIAAGGAGVGGQFADPGVVEVRAGALAVVRRCVGPGCHGIGFAVDPYLPDVDDVVRIEQLAARDRQRRECGAIGAAARRAGKVQRHGVGAGAGDLHVGGRNAVALGGGVVGIARAVGHAPVLAVEHDPGHRLVQSGKVYRLVQRRGGGGQRRIHLRAGAVRDLPAGQAALRGKAAAAVEFGHFFIHDAAVGAAVQAVGVPQHGAETVEVAVVQEVVVVVPEVFLLGAVLQQDGVFADDHTVALFGKGGHLFQQAVLFLIVVHIAPAGDAGCSAVVPGRVVVDRHHQLVLGRVGGHHKAAVAGVLDVGVVPRNEQEAVGIVAACGADGIHKGLVDPVGGGVALILGEGARIFGDVGVVQPVAQLLVARLKDQVVAVLGVPPRDLGPHRDVHLHGLFADGGGRRAEHPPPAAVPVVVDDDVHIVVEGVPDDLLDAVEVSRVDGVVAALEVHGVGPRHRDAQRVKAGGLHPIHHGLGRHRHPPQRLIDGGVLPHAGGQVAVGFHRVAQIDAVAHQPGHFDGGQLFADRAAVRRRSPRPGQGDQSAQHRRSRRDESFQLHTRCLLGCLVSLF